MTTLPPPGKQHRREATLPATAQAADPATVTGPVKACEGVPQFLVLALQPSATIGWRVVGRYLDYPSAQRAHVGDVLAQLDGNDGWLLTCEHLLIGPDLDGSIGCWPQLVSVGADPSSDRIPDPYDRAGWQHWLECTHQAAGLE
jgi:hypothetical protein